MQANTAVMRSILIFAVVAFTVCSASERVKPCCVTVSRTRVVEPIKSYTLQERNLPCVKAVIFETEKGQFCVDPRQPWVRGLIVAFNKSQKDKEAPISETPVSETPISETPVSETPISETPISEMPISVSPRLIFSVPATTVSS